MSYLYDVSFLGTALERNLASVDETRSSLLASRTSLESAAEAVVAELRAQDAHEQQLRARRDQLEEQRRVLTYQRDALQIEVRTHAEECSAAYRDKDALDAKFPAAAPPPPPSPTHADALGGTLPRFMDRILVRYRSTEAFYICFISCCCVLHVLHHVLRRGAAATSGRRV